MKSIIALFAGARIANLSYQLADSLLMMNLLRHLMDRGVLSRDEIHRIILGARYDARQMAKTDTDSRRALVAQGSAEFLDDLIDHDLWQDHSRLSP